MLTRFRCTAAGSPIVLVLACVVCCCSAWAADAPAGWTLRFEDSFERAELGSDWAATGLTRTENGVLAVGREGELGRSLVVCTKQFLGAIRLEYDAMAPVETPCDLSATINGGADGESSAFFFGFGSQSNTTGRFLIKGQPGREYPAVITPNKWHHVVCERYGKVFRHIIDGKTVMEYTHPGPLPGPLDREIAFYVWHVGCFDNVKVYTRPEQVEVVNVTEGSMPSTELVVKARAYPMPGKIGLSVDVPATPLCEHIDITATLSAGGTPVPGTALHAVGTPGMRDELIFDAHDLAPGTYSVVVSAVMPMDCVSVAWDEVEWPGRDTRFDGIEVLNNLCWRLLKVQDAGGISGTHTFNVPIDRWLVIETTAEPGSGTVSVMLDSDDPAKAVSVHADGSTALRVKRLVKAGEHSITVKAEGGARLSSLEVRAIPDVQHSRFLNNTYQITNGGPYDLEFLRRYVLPSATTLITNGGPGGNVDFLREWVAAGGRCIGYGSRPEYTDNADAEKDADALFAHFTAREGFSHELMSGVLVDEFYTPNDPAYPAYTEMIRRINADPKYTGKGFYPYAAGAYGKDAGSAEFSKACIEGGGMVCWEAYLSEWNTRHEAVDYMRRYIERVVLAAEDRLPGVTQHTVWVPGTFSFPWPFADGYPNVNYNAYLDMQCHMLANHPAFFGLGGVHIWRSGYTDEERMRWMWRMFEHYCIQGRRDRVSSAPYELTHIKNPDFTEGFDGWTVDASGEGAVRAGQHRGYGKLQGRYYRGNDTFCVLRRSAAGSNTISQTISGLQVGRTYSVKLLSADYGELLAGSSVKAIHPMSVAIDGAELVEGAKYQYQEPYSTRGRLGGFTDQTPLWINLHWHVFRATGTSATLKISDWVSPNQPGGPEGQELAINFVEVKPYLMD